MVRREDRNSPRATFLFNWAIDEGYLTQTPFRREGRPTIKLDSTVENGS
jgi:hypothetical protein